MIQMTNGALTHREGTRLGVNQKDMVKHKDQELTRLEREILADTVTGGTRPSTASGAALKTTCRGRPL